MALVLDAPGLKAIGIRRGFGFNKHGSNDIQGAHILSFEIMNPISKIMGLNTEDGPQMSKEDIQLWVLYMNQDKNIRLKTRAGNVEGGPGGYPGDRTLDKEIIKYLNHFLYNEAGQPKPLSQYAFKRFKKQAKIILESTLPDAAKDSFIQIANKVANKNGHKAVRINASIKQNSKALKEPLAKMEKKRNQLEKAQQKTETETKTKTKEKVGSHLHSSYNNDRSVIRSTNISKNSNGSNIRRLTVDNNTSVSRKSIARPAWNSDITLPDRAVPPPIFNIHSDYKYNHKSNRGKDGHEMFGGRPGWNDDRALSGDVKAQLPVSSIFESPTNSIPMVMTNVGPLRSRSVDYINIPLQREREREQIEKQQNQEQEASIRARVAAAEFKRQKQQEEMATAERRAREQEEVVRRQEYKRQEERRIVQEREAEIIRHKANLRQEEIRKEQIRQQIHEQRQRQRQETSLDQLRQIHQQHIDSSHGYSSHILPGHYFNSNGSFNGYSGISSISDVGSSSSLRFFKGGQFCGGGERAPTGGCWR